MRRIWPEEFYGMCAKFKTGDLNTKSIGLIFSLRCGPTLISFLQEKAHGWKISDYPRLMSVNHKSLSLGLSKSIFASDQSSPSLRIATQPPQPTPLIYLSSYLPPLFRITDLFSNRLIILTIEFRFHFCALLGRIFFAFSWSAMRFGLIPLFQSSWISWRFTNSFGSGITWPWKKQKPKYGAAFVLAESLIAVENGAGTLDLILTPAFTKSDLMVVFGFPVCFAISDKDRPFV